MKNRFLIGFFLCVLMAVQIGCSNNTSNSKEVSNSRAQTGRYVEEKLKKSGYSRSERFLALRMEDNGNPTYYSWLYSDRGKAMYQYSLIDDIYKKIPLSCYDEILKENGENVIICFGEDGQYYFLVQGVETINLGTKTERYKYFSRLFKSDKEFASYEEITPIIWNQEVWGNELFKGTKVSNIQITSNGTLLYQEYEDSNILAYSLIDKVPIHNFAVQAESEFIVRENTLCFISEGAREIRTLDCETKEEKVYEYKNLQSNSKLQLSKEGTLYLLDEYGIHRLVENTTLWETVVDGALFSMGVPSLVPASFIVIGGEKEQYYVYYQSKIRTEKDVLACYKFDETASPTTEKNLTIFSLWENTSLREAISLYQEQHSNVRINYLVAMNDGTDTTLEEQIGALTTELRAGKGADILLLDGLPMGSYINMSLLDDISDVLMPWVTKGSLLRNIANNYIQEDRIYGMPIRFYVPLYTTSENFKEPIVSLEQLSKAAVASDKMLFPPITYQSLLQVFLYTYYNNFISDGCQINETELRTFLTQVKMIADNLDIIEHEKESATAKELLSGDDTRINKVVIPYTVELSITNSMATIGYAREIIEFTVADACAAYKGGDYCSINNTFIPNGIIGFNKASQEDELAKDFIRFVFSDENQLTHTGDGFPLNTTAFNFWMNALDRYNTPLNITGLDEEGYSVDLCIDRLTSEKINKVSTMIKQLTTPVNNNASLIDLIIEEAIPYLRNEKDIDKVCQNIIHKANLNE